MNVLLPISMISWPAAFILLGISAKTDLKDRIIPNELVVAIAAIGLAHTLLTRPGLIWLSLFAAVSLLPPTSPTDHCRVSTRADGAPQL
jgi:prepilin peptidase CpaA